MRKNSHLRVELDHKYVIHKRVIYAEMCPPARIHRHRDWIATWEGFMAISRQANLHYIVRLCHMSRLPCEDHHAGCPEDSRWREGQRNIWMDSVREWTDLDAQTLLRLALDRPRWIAFAASAFLASPLRLVRSACDREVCFISQFLLHPWLCSSYDQYINYCVNPALELFVQWVGWEKMSYR